MKMIHPSEALRLPIHYLSKPLELRHLAYNILRYYYLLTKVRPQAVSHISISIVVLVKVTRVSRQLKMAIGKHGGLWTLISIWERMRPRSSVGWKQRTTGWNNASNLGPSNSRRHLCPHRVDSIILN